MDDGSSTEDESTILDKQKQKSQESDTPDGDLFVTSNELVRLAPVNEFEEGTHVAMDSLGGSWNTGRGQVFEFDDGADEELSVAVFKYQGQFYAINDRCPHAGGMLEKCTRTPHITREHT